MPTLQDSTVPPPAIAPPSPLLLKESDDTLHQLQLMVAAMAKFNLRRTPEFQELMAQYKLLGTKLHAARLRLPPPPPPVKAAPAAPRAVSALGLSPRKVPAVAQPPAQVSALGRARQGYGATMGVHATPTPQAPAPHQPLQAQPAAEQAPEVASSAPLVQEPAAPETPALPALPLALPKFAATLGPPGTKCVDAGPPVAHLQQLLAALGYKVHVSGQYDVLTFRAVQELQKKHKLPVMGVIGLETRKLLNGMVTG